MIALSNSSFFFVSLSTDSFYIIRMVNHFVVESEEPRVVVTLMKIVSNRRTVEVKLIA